MVLFFESNVLAPEIPVVLVYMGIDKVESASCSFSRDNLDEGRLTLGSHQMNS